MISKRTQSRIEAVKIIYESIINKVDLADLIKQERFLELDNVTRSFLELVISNQVKINEIISNTLENYSMQRLNIIDLAIVNLATAEMLDKKTPKAIIINEALKISDEYTKTEKDNTTKFNNRLLENIANNIGI